ncbi:lipopolysaccharide kinase InaA family protein [Pseudomonas rubra]|uniref:Toluene tolerance protein n=1 Tax=Pseudomonas rubra TaxID=2942627 RepID=A0ABT5P7U0_9PSED|nr:lipopolysaccharide kinase InaA family protein [Pseudomonas rubra]MDD1014133.1 toluene tolerance protein [Pseudomonas rubra]MDD1039067.1 toluene tolerance protein [Pseudomonas rubra]MDD1154179.1 toluene tolerance protein [Pseudomonas rubra]
MQAMDHTTYMSLREGAHVLEADGSGDKVLRLHDGRMLKLFRRKRLLSSALLYPYARRFANNAQALRQLGVPSPEVIGVYRIPSIQRDAVYYAPLAGETLRQLLHKQEGAQTLRAQLGHFIAHLHNLGIYFRSLHLGNVVLTPERELGLIDLADLQRQSRPLSERQRVRNFRHVLRYTEDRQWLLGDDNGAAFLEGYREELEQGQEKPRPRLLNTLRQLLD